MDGPSNSRFVLISGKQNLHLFHITLIGDWLVHVSIDVLCGLNSITRTIECLMVIIFIDVNGRQACVIMFNIV